MHDIYPLKSVSHGVKIKLIGLGYGRLGEDLNYKLDSAFPLVRIESSKTESWQG